MNNMILGVLLVNLSLMHTVPEGSNTVAYMPESKYEITQFLNALDNRYQAMIKIDSFYLNNGRYTYRNPADIYDAVFQSNYHGDIIWLFDEPIWRATEQTDDEVLSILRRIVKDFPSDQFFHVEAAPIILRQMEDSGQVNLLTEADYVGFNCYGPVDNCYGKHHLWYLGNMYQNIYRSGSNARLFITAGSFLHRDFMTENQIISHILDYTSLVMKYPNYLGGGLGFFLWDRYQDFSGAVENPRISQATSASLSILNSLKNSGVK